ncbi:transposase [Streptomyces sp. NEAU-sy36]|uniref:transposase n=1 Tax=unclassified Streptomyces TaxID=2593676 RepID=UPI0015D6169E|nr:transposase [Streptomyces sp. NEAU-sy36]
MRRGPERGLRDPALGRSRGGLTSKIHLACDGRGRPLGFVVTGGSTNDCTQFTAVMEAIRVPRLGPGRPRMLRTWSARSGIVCGMPWRRSHVRMALEL